MRDRHHDSAGGPVIRTTVRSALRAGLAASLLVAVLPSPILAEESAPFRVGFSRTLFTGVNDGDARAAIMAWARTVARERGLSVDPSARIFDRSAEISDALKRGTVDAASVTFPEYQAIAVEVRTGPWFVTRTSGALLERYVLLVHEESGYASLGALEGRSLELHVSARTCLARDWLDSLALGAGHRGGASALLGEIREASKVSGAVLPVFFRTADAGVATDSAFATMRELNPQLGRKLRILARSRSLVPAVMLFRRDFESPEKDRLLVALNELHETPAGQQVLTIFQSEALVQVGEEPLDATEAFLAEVDALRSGSGAAGASPGTLGRGEASP